MDIKNENAFALYSVLLVIILGSVFVITTFDSIVANMKLAENIKLYNKAFYSADAGVTYAKYLIKKENGIPLKMLNGDDYTPGEIYEYKDLYGGSSFKLSFHEVLEYTNLYEVEVQGKYENAECFINVLINNQGNIMEYKFKI